MPTTFKLLRPTEDGRNYADICNSNTERNMEDHDDIEQRVQLYCLSTKHHQII
jgi:hypothetical protein